MLLYFLSLPEVMEDGGSESDAAIPISRGSTARASLRHFSEDRFVDDVAQGQT